MFSGLVEGLAPVLDVKAIGRGLRLCLKKPASFRSLKEGESLCVDGLCLTLESFDKKSLRFFLGPETLKITKWKAQDLKGWIFNLERSLSLQSRIGGHLVTGHIDGLARLKQITKQGDSRIAQIQIPPNYKKFFLEKRIYRLKRSEPDNQSGPRDFAGIMPCSQNPKADQPVSVKKGRFFEF